MTAILIYVKTLEGALGGPLYSSVDLFRLLRSTHEVKLLVDSDLEEIVAAAGALGLEPGDIASAADYLSGGPDFPHLLHVQHVFDPMAARLVRSARSRGVKVVLSPRGALDDWALQRRAVRKAPAVAFMKRAFWQKADAIHCTADLEADQVRKLLTQPIHTAPNVVSLAWGAGRCSIAEKPRALFLSRLHEKKRPDLVLAGIAPLLRDGRLECLTLAGGGSEDGVARLRSQAEQLGIESRVDFVGELDEQGCRRAYLSHEVFVLPTSQENFGRVLFEASAFGMAVFVPPHIDSWPELERLGAYQIEQSATSISRRVGLYIDEPLAIRRSASDLRRSASQDALSRESLLRVYSSMYEAVASG